MARKLCVLKLNGSSLHCFNLKSIENKISGARFAGATFYENGYWHIVGKSYIKMFANEYLEEIKELEKVFKDSESKAEQQTDIKTLQSYLKIKAS